MKCYVTRRLRQANESNIPYVRRFYASSKSTCDLFELGHLVLSRRLPRLELQAMDGCRLPTQDTVGFHPLLV